MAMTDHAPFDAAMAAAGFGQTPPPVNREQARAAGWEGGQNIYHLDFQDPQFAGLDVRAKGVPMRKFLDWMRSGSLTTMVGGTIELTPATGEVVAEFFEEFGRALIEWNLTNGGVPVPATLDGLLSQDPRWVMDVMGAWMQGVMGTSAPLGAGSNSGAPFPEASIPMAPLSPNPPS